MLLAREGARVHVVDINAERVAEVVAEIARKGGSAVEHVADCSDEAAVEKLAGEVLGEEGHVDVVHLNAGIGHAGRVEDITLDEWRRVLDVNLWSVVLGIHAFVPAMLEKGNGHVVVTASGLGLIPLGGVAPYTTTKFALVGMAESLDGELRSRGVRVTALCPGVINTDIIRASAFSGESEAERAQAATFFGRRGASPQRVADDVVAAIRRPRTIVVSPRWHVLPLWVVHRVAPGTFVRLAGRIAGRLSIVPTSSSKDHAG
jgi:NAD(P)-dependent dehydrogenase (short-subunit alcohol dehydrogenase family)